MNQIRFFDYRNSFGVEMVIGRQVKHEFCRHTHQRLCLGMVEEGERILLCGEKSHRIRPGEMFLLLPGQPHACESKDGHDYQLLLLEPELPGKFLPEAAYGNVRTVFSMDACLERFRRLGNVLAGEECVFYKQAELTALLGEAFESAGVMPFEGSAAAVDEGKLMQVRLHIEQNYARTITLEQLAKVAELSPYHLLRRFARCFGVPPHAYLQQERIRQARALLARGHSGAEIALAVGFGDQSHFCNVFKKLMGISPGRYAEALVGSAPENL